MKKTKISLIRRVLIHGFFGCLAGLSILHPISMFINDPLKYDLVYFITFQQIFAPQHLQMAGYFAILGGAIGVIHALYVQNKAKLYAEINFLSITDELTSLYNRRYFISQLTNEIERASRYSHYLSLLMIDLNDFKQYNDTHGHQRGDERLKTVAMRLKNAVRTPDFVARYGGDEFVIVMPEADKDKALKLEKRLHEKVEAYTFTDKMEVITVSIGTATFPSEAQDMEGLINKADSMLYMVKKRRASEKWDGSNKLTKGGKVIDAREKEVLN